MSHHRHPYRVKFDVTVATQQIGHFPDQTGAESPFPQRPTTAVGSIDILHVTLPQAFHYSRRTVAAFRCYQQMDVIGH